MFGKRIDIRVVWGLLLIVGGALFLLENLKLLPGGAIFWGSVLGVGGLVFLGAFFADRTQWWALIPGCTLLGLSGTVLLDLALPQRTEEFGGLLVLGSIGLSFWLVYLARRDFWWAIIPAGVLTTLAGVAWLSSNRLEISSALTGGVFFLGLGATFLLLSLLPTEQGRMRWPLIPGGILLAMGVFIALAAESLLNYLWPIALILGGLALLWRNFRR